jgi:hypothetical protein
MSMYLSKSSFGSHGVRQIEHPTHRRATVWLLVSSCSEFDIQIDMMTACCEFDNQFEMMIARWLLSSTDTSTMIRHAIIF